MFHRKKRILILEDDVNLNNIWTSRLRKDGFLVDQSSDGEDGLQKAKYRYYNLIYTGILMPKINGIDFLKTLQKEQIKHGKIIVFSNLDDKDVIDQAIEAGADKYMILGKTTPDEGIDTMEEMLGKSIKTKQELPFKQDFINHLIWLLIVNVIFAHFGRQMEKGTINTLGQIIWLITGFFLFGFLFAFTKVLRKRIHQYILSFIAALIFIAVVNLMLLAVIP